MMAASSTLQRLSAGRPTVAPLFRRGILGATHNPVVSGLVRARGMQLGAARFVAGESFDQAIPVLRSLNDKGLRTNTTLLGEGTRDEDDARNVVAAYKQILDQIATADLITNVALKLTHLGLALGEDIAFRNVADIVAHAGARSNFVRIDMEESERVSASLTIYERLRAEGHDNVGMVLQSYLYRSADDLSRLLPLRPNLRIVKGAYLEPATVAYPSKADVDRSFIQLAEQHLNQGGFTAIATHDPQLIDHFTEFATRQGLGTDHFEFQMLYGIRPTYQVDLVKGGHRVLVATPFGPEWYFYLMRRLAERPANLVWFAGNLLKR